MRHFLVCTIVSAILPGIGSLTCHFGGIWYENNYPSPDAEQDLSNNRKGILAGTTLGIIIWSMILGIV